MLSNTPEERPISPQLRVFRTISGRASRVSAGNEMTVWGAAEENLLKSNPESWAETFQTNLTAQFFTTIALLPLLAKGHEASPGYSTSVVNVASISGVMKGSSNGQFAYATSKAGMCALIGLDSYMYRTLYSWLGRLHSYD